MLQNKMNNDSYLGASVANCVKKCVDKLYRVEDEVKTYTKDTIYEL